MHDPASTANWFPAAMLFVFGAPAHLGTLLVQSAIAWEGLRHKRVYKSSSWPFLGPVCFTLGFALIPVAVPLWAWLLPWILELLAIGVAGSVQYRVGRKLAQEKPTS